MPPPLFEKLERLVRRDPARRGLIAGEPRFGPLCPGHLGQAARDLADRGRSAAIVTGFFVPGGHPPAAETDGPPGAVMLAWALRAAGLHVVLLTDQPCASAVIAAAEAGGLSQTDVLVCPHDSDEWIDRFCSHRPGRELTHLLAVERVGPSHTPESLCARHRNGPPPLEEFLARVPPEAQGRCHNMRGEIIDAHTAGLHRLFEELPRLRSDVRTIGIGDGGNEIGMGCVPWEELVRRLDGRQAPRIPCRVATDWNIVAGVSNWGAFALAAAVLALRGRRGLLHAWDLGRHQELLERMVEHGPAVDGVTGRREPTVDGLPFLTYIQTWEGIRRLPEFSSGRTADGPLEDPETSEDSTP